MVTLLIGQVDPHRMLADQPDESVVNGLDRWLVLSPVTGNRHNLHEAPGRDSTRNAPLPGEDAGGVTGE
jgi:hypothetical protein